MLMGVLASPWRVSIVLVAGVAAGVVNGLAGGGTFITFPALLGVGVPALRANLSTTVGVLPSYVGSLRIFRRQLRPHRRLVRSLVPICVAGTASGCACLLLATPSTFRSVVPWLIGAGTVLFALSPVITRSLAQRGEVRGARRFALYAGIFVASAYGGYFGAGMGIVLLAVMALTLPVGIEELQGLRNALSLIINSLAAVIFIVHGGLAVEDVVLLLMGTLVGGWLGALLVVRLSSALVRAIVVVVGAATTIKLAIG